MMTNNKKPLTDVVEQKARAIGERLMKMHAFMDIRRVEVIEDGVVLVDRVGEVRQLVSDDFPLCAPFPLDQ